MRTVRCSAFVQICARALCAGIQKKKDPCGSLFNLPKRSCYFLLPPLRPGLPGTPPCSSFERSGLPWLELPGSQPSGPLPTPWLHFCFAGGFTGPLVSQPVTVVPVSVTAAFDSRSPFNVPRVTVMAAPARTVPTNFESVMVTACATCQYTWLHASALPPCATTEKLVPVNAPVPSVPILKIHVAFEEPASVNTLPVDVAAASTQ